VPFIPERQAAIVARLQREGRVVSAELAEELRVSIDSIRRDLQELEAEGRVRRVHGGALRPLPGKTRFLERLEDDEPRRQLLAGRAAELIADDQLVVIGGGTTALEWARALRRDIRGTVLTTSLDVAIELRSHPTLTVDVLGGRLDRASQTLTGAGTVAGLRAVRPDVCIVSPCWLHLDHGVTLRERAEAEVVKIMIEQSRRVIAIAGETKLGWTGPYVVAETDRLDALVTDGPERQIVPFGELGIELITPWPTV
jgi:DeoR/GlpR family transcriptional regulator of sugar metabolism